MSVKQLVSMVRSPRTSNYLSHKQYVTHYLRISGNRQRHLGPFQTFL